MDELAGVLAVMIPIVGSVALFTFLAIGRVADNRRMQEEARAKYEFLRKMAEGGSFDVQKYMEFEQVEAAARRERKIENLKIGGLILLGIGIALSVFLALIGDREDGGNVAAVGVIPAMIGLALFAGAWMMARSRRGIPGAPTPRG
jgi:uncharacterized membrane protein YqjE